VSERHARTERDRRRRELGQNFLVDRRTIPLLIDGLGLTPGELVVDVGAGTGALTLPLARAGVEVWAVEADTVWAERLAAEAAVEGLAVRVIRADLRRLRMPRRPFRVVANPPFGLTTELLGKLLDDPARGPARADLIVQREVARKHAATPPRALRTAAWAPWWEFELGIPIDRDAFRPRPDVDAQVLSIRRRTPPILPPRLGPAMLDLLRPHWRGTAWNNP
jgi:23S rRNA (adenine-N6)-dimethyltransferase